MTNDSITSHLSTNDLKSRDSIPRNSVTGDSLDVYIAAAAGVLGLRIEPAWAPVVKQNLAVILAQASLIDEVALPDDAEPAPVYEL